MQAQDPRSTHPFARPEYGFYLRSSEEWGKLFSEAGFSEVDAQSIESVQRTLEGIESKRYSVRVSAKR